MKKYNESRIRVSFDNQSILSNLEEYELKWNQLMDLIHLSIESRLNPERSLFQYIEHDMNLSHKDKRSLFWKLSEYADEAVSQLPELPADMSWETIREYDLEIQTWAVTRPLIINDDIAMVHLNRFERYLKNEELEGTVVPMDVYKHISNYGSLLRTFRAEELE